ncbi:Transcriptional regulator, contains XRE-family HTH domain [Mucilaginibacter pineti]|uniref:Transcriptional regulator, contains XRE-family HTH domain n=1 Tax=Mucilaginibacter pineti TaxID=1391627 RepID=A0A1G7H5V1_9SPHI|nr:helix-turn-helix transcriptional regulator [Mucilaginibacter pineti]SDE95837.1 Transcriptional regulator, contains XRE-family HTH domain [Mucilaginibacter pineti]
MKTLGQNIRLLRHQKGWSQEIVAKMLDVSIPAYSKIETGITDINLSRLEQVASVYGISTVQLLALGEANEVDGLNILEDLYQKLAVRETEVIDLQKKVIELFEAIRIGNETT